MLCICWKTECETLKVEAQSPRVLKLAFLRMSSLSLHTVCNRSGSFICPRQTLWRIFKAATNAALSIKFSLTSEEKAVAIVRS